MTLLENIIIGIGLSMDACMIAFSKGYSWQSNKLLLLASSFGIFQCIMTIIGYYFGNYFISVTFTYTKILLFLMLLYIGAKMMKNEDYIIDNFLISTIILYSVLTSIDALSIGITFSYRNINIKKSSCIIGLTTFILSLIGSMIGKYIQNRKIKNLNKIGGIIIILYGFKLLLLG